MRLWLAFQAFFQVLFNPKFADRVRRLQLDEHATPERGPAPAEPPKPKVAEAMRSDAITLLATLQREARFVDIVCESLDGYSDAQIGAAARDVLRDCGKVVQRMFEIEPLSKDQEGDRIEVPAGYDTARIRLTGNVSGEPPFAGQLAHPGWLASKCEIPKWSGSSESALVVAAAEVQVG